MWSCLLPPLQNAYYSPGFSLMASFYCPAVPSFSAGPSATEMYSGSIRGTYLTLLLAVSFRHFKFKSLSSLILTNYSSSKFTHLEFPCIFLPFLPSDLVQTLLILT